MVRPCCCHVLSPWLDKLGLMFSISGLLGTLLLYDTCNYWSYFLCCYLIYEKVIQQHELKHQSLSMKDSVFVCHFYCTSNMQVFLAR